MFYNSLIKEYTARYLAVKKIKVQESTVEAAVENLICFIRCINDMSEDKTSTPDGTQFSNIQIPSEMKDLVLPSAIRVFPGDRRCVDLRIRGEVKPQLAEIKFQKDENTGSSKSYVDFKDADLDDLRIATLDAISILRGLQRRNSSEDLVTIDSVRKEISLMDALPRLCNKDNLVTQDGNFFIPFKIKGCDHLFTDRYFTQDADFTIREFVRSVIQ